MIIDEYVAWTWALAVADCIQSASHSFVDQVHQRAPIAYFVCSVHGGLPELLPISQRLHKISVERVLSRMSGDIDGLHCVV